MNKQKKRFFRFIKYYKIYILIRFNMPNYTKNTLIVKGSKDALTYFYNRNRISEEDAQNIGGIVTDLSFEKCVTRENDTIIMTYIKENYISKHPKPGYDCWDLTCTIWGTKWEAIDTVVDLSTIEDGKITYYFDTAWCYPHNWLLTVSKIFSKLEFEIISLDEDDNYNMCYKHQFKEGTFEMIESYSRLERSIEKYGVENLVNMIITHCEEEDLTMMYKGVNVNWKMYYKVYLEENHNVVDNETYFASYVIDYVDDFLYKHEMYHGIYENKEFCKLFVEKVKKMIDI